MSTRRIQPLFSTLFRPSTSATIAEGGFCPHRTPRAGFRTLPPRRSPEVAPRYGTANEPPPHLGVKKPVAPSEPKDNAEQRALPTPAIGQVNKAAKKEQETPKEGKQEAQTAIGAEYKAKNEDTANTLPSSTERGRTHAKPEQPESGPNALSQILGMESPMSETSEDKPPHLQAPPYVHHFDTFTLVRALEEDNAFTPQQSILIMKAIRQILADNMELARDGLVSKGDSEMAAYLFRAACSELRTEMKNNRSTLTERMRTERSSLQHEVDILSQRISAETDKLSDELKGMFNDRKMNVRIERRDIENRIQELNYSITTKLNSEMKSQVEGLRWVLVRRTAMALAFVVFTALLVLTRRSENKKRAISANASSTEGSGPGQNSVVPDRMKALEGGGDPSLVSLG